MLIKCPGDTIFVYQLTTPIFLLYIIADKFFENIDVIKIKIRTSSFLSYNLMYEEIILEVHGKGCNKYGL